MPLIEQNNKNKSPQWDIRDTEFVIRLITSSSVNGTDLEQALSVLNKFKDIHSKLLNKGINF
jgi:hypothetical protein